MSNVITELRSALEPSISIKPYLNLNSRPKACDDLSLVNAENIILSNDANCIVNEDSISLAGIIGKFIHDNFYNYKIIHLCPCNDELLIFIVNNYDENNLISIVRYNERTYNIKIVNNKLIYNGGTIKTTFTYNVDNSLILAFAENGVEGKQIPLRTINLGDFDGNNNNDNNLSDSKLSILPEVIIPRLTGISYIKGRAYKGWYSFYIRYKINKNDYTQWYNFGEKILIDEGYNRDIFRYPYDNKDNTILNIGFKDYISDDFDICNKTIEFSYTKDNSFEFYQIGFICSTNNYDKVYISNDIYTSINKFILDFDVVKEYNIEELTLQRYNILNVNNIVNYRNKLYISNYEEIDLGNLELSANNVFIGLYKTTFDIKLYSKTYSICNYTSKINTLYEFENDSGGYIPAYIYLGYKSLNEVGDKTIQIKGPVVTSSSDGSVATITTITAKIKDIILLDSARTAPVLDINTRFIKVLIYRDNTNIIDYYVYPFFNSNGTENTHSIANLTFANDESKAPVFFLSNETKILYGDEILITNNNETSLTQDCTLLNSNESLNDRVLNRGLIPGEVYNFYIHYVDKYGQASLGYKLSPKPLKLKYSTGGENNVFPYKILSNTEGSVLLMILTSYTIGDLKRNSSIYKFNGDNINYIEENQYEIYINADNNIGTNGNELLSYLTNEFSDRKYDNYRLIDILDPYDIGYFIPYENSNGDILFRVPINNDNNIITYEEGTTTNMKTRYFVGARKKASYSRYMINIPPNTINIPYNCEGYFISCEKFESRKIFTGLLSKYDYNQIKTNNKYDYNKTDCYFYTDDLNTNTELSLDYDIVRIESKNNFTTKLIDFSKDGIKILAGDDILDYNLFQSYKNFEISTDNYNAYYPAGDNRLLIADNNSDNRYGLGTCIQFNNLGKLFDLKTIETEYGIKYFPLYKVSLISAKNDIYLSKTKTLIRISDVIYNNSPILINRGNYNGIYNFKSAIVYNRDTVTLDTSANKLINNKGEDYGGTLALFYFKYFTCSEIIDDTKRFKNKPLSIVRALNASSEKSISASGVVIIPKNSVDLFTNPIQGCYYKDFNTYINHNQNISYITKFNKTIRRSNVISDESRQNSWRIFNPEDYKNITENKGNITNLIGVGYLFLIHTEYSMFVLDTNNILQTEEKAVQLDSLDVFNVDYKEIFTDKLGFGGLLDGLSAIYGQFGYIYYNDKEYKFYNFDNSKLNIISDDIKEFLYKLQPTNVRFIDDEYNNRLLITFTTLYNDIYTLSYNYKIGKFISFHNYSWYLGVNTSHNIYMMNKYSEIYGSGRPNVINENIFEFNRFDKGQNPIPINEIKEYTWLDIYQNRVDNNISKISFIHNYKYEEIKFLEFIKYKIRKYNEVTNIYSPVEKSTYTYAGNAIRIYNDVNDTGELDITTNEVNYNTKSINKPYLYLGAWHFNYIRDNIINHGDSNPSDDLRRLFGNFFIIEFTFNNSDNKRIEFEELNSNISKQNKI